MKTIDQSIQELQTKDRFADAKRANQFRPRKARKTPKVVLTHGPTHCDVLVIRRSYTPLDRETVELFKNWLQARRVVVTMQPDIDLPLPGGIFDRINLKGCHVVAEGRRVFWDQPDPTIDTSLCNFAQVEGLERVLRFEISKIPSETKEAPALFKDVSVPQARKLRVSDAAEGLLSGRLQAVDPTFKLEGAPPMQKIDVFEREGRKMVSLDIAPEFFRNVEVRRICWADARGVMSLFRPKFWWGEMDAEEGYAQSRPGSWRVWEPSGKGELPYIANAPKWLQEYLQARNVHFVSGAEYAAHVFRTRPLGSWVRASYAGPQQAAEAAIRGARHRDAV